MNEDFPSCGSFLLYMCKKYAEALAREKIHTRYQFYERDHLDILKTTKTNMESNGWACKVFRLRELDDQAFKKIYDLRHEFEE